MSRYILNTGREGEGKRERRQTVTEAENERENHFYGMLLW